MVLYLKADSHELHLTCAAVAQSVYKNRKFPISVVAMQPSVEAVRFKRSLCKSALNV